MSVGLEDATKLTLLCQRALMACGIKQSNVVSERGLTEGDRSNLPA